ncbi:hypothetical protein B4V02_23980 [Paenibacillus kribbensis]|uniref:Uncharacterized protein n=1 Tax=Paenibacillus kribbensis TaxID=172713 RepID=A0A222WTN4_9BACL|nr:hypothetical protein [Paenibacillus kribbensis]ASR49526.1 hypothetical protein B4V02_23980 [Paenibacillus kribbensis]
MERVEFVLNQLRDIIPDGTGSEKEMVAGGYIIRWIKESRQKNELTLKEVHDLMDAYELFLQFEK